VFCNGCGHREECHVIVLSKREGCLAMVAGIREESHVIVLSKRERVSCNGCGQ
jgi:hypothetical protein